MLILKSSSYKVIQTKNLLSVHQKFMTSRCIDIHSKATKRPLYDVEVIKRMVTFSKESDINVAAILLVSLKSWFLTW